MSPYRTAPARETAASPLAPDYRPYLLETDLRTPEDVVAWLRSESAAWREPGIEHGDELVRFDATVSTALAHAASYVFFRLDRERRQACRRGAAAYFAAAKRHREAERDWLASNPDDTFTREFLDEWAKNARACRRDRLTMALAFRAAAREP